MSMNCLHGLKSEFDVAGLSFILFTCGEMLPSVLRPPMGPMHNPTSPNGFKKLRGFCKPQKDLPVHVT